MKIEIKLPTLGGAGSQERANSTSSGLRAHQQADGTITMEPRPVQAPPFPG